jgi:hypothetical protein
LKYIYKIDKRDSHLRPTKGYAFQSTSQVGGLWNSKGLRYFRQVILLPFLPDLFSPGPCSSLVKL